MYREFFGFQLKPFSKTPDPEFLYLSKQHREALARMEYSIEEKDLFLLTGEIGTGKTTLTRALMDQVEEEKYKFIVILNPRLSPSQFLKVIAKGLGTDKIPSNRADLNDLIYEKLYDYYEKGATVVVIIDEAQLIPAKPTFDEIRLMTNFQLDDENLLALLMVAQPELNRRFRHPAYKALVQRIGMRYHLGPLDFEDTKKYIEFRIKKAGREEPIFTDDATEIIYKYSEGLPRVINNIATNALLSGFGKEEDPVSADTVIDVVKDLSLGKAWGVHSIGGHTSG